MHQSSEPMGISAIAVGYRNLEGLPWSLAVMGSLVSTLGPLAFWECRTVPTLGDLPLSERERGLNITQQSTLK